jgi:glyoxylase-like metal-dependent hydrolase (beta-lactamase superfamily II)
MRRGISACWSTIVLLAGDAAWGSDLLAEERRMRAVPRALQHDGDAYRDTARRLVALSRAGIRVVCSHDPVGDRELLRDEPVADPRRVRRHALVASVAHARLGGARQRRLLRRHLRFLRRRSAYFRPARGELGPRWSSGADGQDIMMDRFDELNTVGVHRDEAMRIALASERSRLRR